MELTITMLISSILLGIIYLAFAFFQQNIRLFASKSEELVQLSQLQYLLNKDIGQARLVIATSDGLIANKDSARITYQFQPDYLLRTQGERTDTFLVQVQNKHLFLLNKERFGEQGLIDELAFEVDHRGELFYFHFRKNYDARTLLERQSSDQ